MTPESAVVRISRLASTNAAAPATHSSAAESTAPAGDPRAAIRIFIAGGPAIPRAGLRALLETQPHFVAVGEAVDLADAALSIRELTPDLLIVILSAPRLAGGDLIQSLAAQCASVRTILLTPSLDTSDTVTALQLGVKGVVLEDSPPRMLFKSIRCVFAGEVWLGRQELAEVVRALPSLGDTLTQSRAAYNLTAREREVLTQVVAGYANRDVARRLVKVVENTAGGTATAASFTLTAAGASTISGLGPNVSSGAGFVAGAYTLSESSVTGYSVKTNWICSFGTSGGSQNGSVVTLGIGESATCTIVNQDQKASPTGATVQAAVLHDSMTITGIRAGAPNAASSTVAFKLFSENTCTTQVGVTEVRPVSGGVATTTTGVLVTGTGVVTYYWTAAYSGDQFNNAVTKGCGVETTTINFQNNNVVP